MKISSTAFADQQGIPAGYTGDGGNFSPPLAWSGVPEAARSLALLVDDPDAPGGTWVHWIMFNIPPKSTGFDARVPAVERTADGAIQGCNSSGTIGYDGPYPPQGHGPHRYFFRLYALDTVLTLKPGAEKAAVERAMNGHILAQAQTVGRYERKPGRQVR